MQAHLHPDVFPPMSVLFLTHSWESADAEGLLYALTSDVLYRGLERLWSFVFTGFWNQTFEGRN